MASGKQMRQIQSTVKRDGTVELRLATVDVPEPAADEVLVRVEATPINPSDLGMLLAGADPASLKASGTPDAPVITGPLPDGAARALAGRLDQPMPVGNEGAGVVVKAGTDPAA